MSLTPEEKLRLSACIQEDVDNTEVMGLPKAQEQLRQGYRSIAQCKD